MTKTSPTKVCGKCGEAKPVDELHFPHNKRNADGFDRYCKECWKKRSAEKRAGGNQTARRVIEGVRNAVRAEKKAGWKSVAPALEVVPANVQAVPLKRFPDLPDEQMREMWGSLKEVIHEYEQQFGKQPTVIYVPARFFMPVPKDMDLPGVFPDGNSTKAERPKGRKTRNAK